MGGARGFRIQGMDTDTPDHRIWISLLLTLLALAPAAGAREEPPAEEAEPPVLTGTVTREQVEAAVPDWVEAEVRCEIDTEAAGALTAVAPGADVQVFLGTWCSDSKRELARLWRALDEVAGMVPFELELIAVDRDKKEPEGRQEGLDIRYVPTLIVRRDGEEVGRIVEEAPGGIERDLLALLTGEARGVISAREDL